MLKLVRTVGVVALFSGLAIAVGVWGPNPATSQEKKPSQKPQTQQERDQSTFMRKKLEASNQILEGLVIEDSELVIKGAKVLVEMSTAEKWQVQNNVMYRQYSAEFQQSATKLVEAAQKDNFDGAALRWIDTTLKCMECHKFVRSPLAAKK